LRSNTTGRPPDDRRAICRATARRDRATDPTTAARSTARPRAASARATAARRRCYARVKRSGIRRERLARHPAECHNLY
jgi:hypothetical protein